MKRFHDQFEVVMATKLSPVTGMCGRKLILDPSCKSVMREASRLLKQMAEKLDVEMIWPQLH